MQPRQEQFYGFPQSVCIPGKHGVPVMEPDASKGFFPLPSQLGLVFRKDRIYYPPVKPPSGKYSAFQNRKSMLAIACPTRQRGGARSSRAVRWDAKGRCGVR